jgi:serine/threonine protein kinase
MHSHCGHNIRIHGDIKSVNILLDEELSPKVSDFRSSKVMSSKSRYVKFMASDMNYVDTVYFKTYRFTEKSDVYI